MYSFRSGIAVVLGSTLIAICTSCSYLYQLTGRETHAVNAAVVQAQAYISAGDYKKGLDAYSSASDNYPHNSALRDSYRRAGEQILSAANSALFKKEFAEAGGIYNVLLKSGITSRDFAGSLAFDADYLIKHIKTCSKALLEAGLIKYREGKLEEAITVWKKALAFDHDNKDIKTALDTATIQLQNLKNIK